MADNVIPKVQIRITSEKLLEKYIAWEQIMNAKSALSIIKNKRSKNDNLQDLLESALDLYFSDVHEDIINKTIMSSVKTVARRETKHMLDELYKIFEGTNQKLEYLTSVNNAFYHVNIESQFEATKDNPLFDKDGNLDKSYLETPLSLENHQKTLKVKTILNVANKKRK